MNIVKPRKLDKGDLIGLVTPASLPADLSRISKGVSYLEHMGYNVKVGKNVGSQRGYLAGTDDQRLEDLHDMFADKEVKAIFCVRGGYGSGRLLDRIDYNLIKKNPKIFVGYSDITALQTAFLNYTGLVTFAGPMVAVDFHDEVDPFAEEIFWSTLTSKNKIGKLRNPEDENFYILSHGRSEGQIIGGNLSLICSLLGTKYEPKFEDKILLIEEIGEAPFRVDRMFNQLRLAGVFEKVQGIILGRFVDCYDDDDKNATLSLNEVIADFFTNMEIPVFYNIKHGHIRQNITIPYGLNVKLNTSRKFIEFTEAAVV